MKNRGPSIATLSPLLLLFAISGSATPPPQSGGDLPEAYLERVKEDPTAFTFSSALIGQTARIQRNRAQAASGALSAEEISEAGGIAVQGQRSIPVIPVKFHNTASDPYPVADLQNQLFGASFPTGTMTDYYREVSYGLLTVTGTVRPWQTLSQDDTFYQGADFVGRNGRLQPCHGMCRGAGTGDLLKEALDATDSDLDFGQYDNDGPDGLPNSGDDNGFVDFVAFVHPEVGGECTNAISVKNIWSHRWTYSDWKGTSYTTKDPKKGGGFIRVNDYVITPALACDGTTMIQIGVFAHEFGHAFGLPDLYDTDDSDGESDGVGNWCLMGTGSWGGDGKSPQRPAHLSAWAKAQLGWIFPVTVTSQSEIEPAMITASETNRLAYKIPISSTQYYLVENRQRQGFDDRLYGSGLLIWKINETAVEAGLRSNRVNADETLRGVALEQADGLNHLDEVGDRGDDGDVFAGSSNNHNFHNSSRPASIGQVAVCDIGASGPAMTAILLRTGTCPQAPGTVAAPAPASSPETNSSEAASPAGTHLSIKDLQESPEKYLHRNVRLSGTLVNLGKNYFTDRRIAIQDAEGHTLDIQLRLPLTTGPAGSPQANTLSTVIGKQVEVVGELHQETTAEGEEVLVLKADSSQVVPPQAP